MSFRRRRNEWDEFLKAHQNRLVELGIPKEVIGDRQRFLIFLDHGYDEVGVLNAAQCAIVGTALNDEQIETLADIAAEIDERYRPFIRSRWQLYSF